MLNRPSPLLMPENPPGGRAGAWSAPPILVYLGRLLLLAGVYYAAARLGLRYAAIGESISLVWPPTGVAFAALTLLGYRYWPGVAVGAFLANAGTAVPLAAAVGIAAGNTIEALIAAYLLRRTAGPRPRLEQLSQARTLILTAAPAGALASAAIGVASLALSGALPAAIPDAVAVWWAGDLLGALVVAPIIFAWTVPRPVDQARGILELAGLCLGTVAAAELVLGQLPRISLLQQVDYPYLLFPFVVWAGLRFGARGASLLTLTVSIVAVWHTAQGGGPFVAATAMGTRFAITLYLAALAVTGLILAAAVQWERGRATRALRQSEERLRLALNSARMGIWFLSVDSNNLILDDNMRRLFGLAAGETVSSYEEFTQRVHPDDREMLDDSVRLARAQGGDLDNEFRVLLPGGRVRWIANQGKVGRDEAGRVQYMTGVCLDTTERRLSEDRIRRAHRMESVGRLAGGVAHESNNQMTVVLGAARLILGRSDLLPEVRTDMEYILKAAQRTAAVTAQLLAFSRQQLLRPELLELNGLVQAWEPVLRRVMGEDCVVILRLRPDVGWIKGDAGQLEQVLLNLALNARDAMSHGGTLTVETYCAELTPAYARLKLEAGIRPGSYAVLAVTDTGHGMDRATAAQIFEPFFTTKETGQGTGLGLSTVYGIVKQSEGYIWVYSEPGQGSTFKVYLPIATEAVSAEVTPHVEVVSPMLEGGAAESILVVEDDEAVRQIARRALESVGHEVLEAANGADALALLNRATPPIRLALIDLVLPGMSGPDLAQRVAELAPGTRVIFTSGYPEGEIARRGLLAPETAFIQKPFTPETLIRTVRRGLDVSPAPAADPATRSS
jgi:PAS domain S-box-containing protein